MQLYGCKEFHKDGDRGVSYVEVWCSCTAVKSFIKMEIVASRMWRCGAAEFQMSRDWTLQGLLESLAVFLTVPRSIAAVRRHLSH